MKTIYRMKSMLALLTVPLIALAAPPQSAGNASPTSDETTEVVIEASSDLGHKVRNATEQFKDINLAMAAGFVPASPCVSGSGGAMHIHLILPMLLIQNIGSGVLSIDNPQALLYQSLPNGSLRLVGADYIVLRSAWTSHNPGANPPELGGHPLSLVDDAPNRYGRGDYRHGLPAFYELRVMAVQKPVGSFAAWKTTLTCAQPPSEISQELPGAR
jgi:hypothetical protein